MSYMRAALCSYSARPGLCCCRADLWRRGSRYARGRGLRNLAGGDNGPPYAFGAHRFTLLKEVALVIIDLYVHACYMGIILRLN